MFSILSRSLLGLSRRVAYVEMMLCKLLIVLFSVLLLVNVSLRYLFNAPLFFAEELAVYILVWMAFFAISTSIQDNTQIRLTLLLEAVPRKVAKAIHIGLDAVMLVMMVVILIWSIRWMFSPAVTFDVAVTLGWPKWPFFLIIPAFGASSSLHLAARLVGGLAEAAADGPMPDQNVGTGALS